MKANLVFFEELEPGKAEIDLEFVDNNNNVFARETFYYVARPLESDYIITDKSDTEFDFGNDINFGKAEDYFYKIMSKFDSEYIYDWESPADKALNNQGRYL